jgi:hypothetical protein
MNCFVPRDNADCFVAPDIPSLAGTKPDAVIARHEAIHVFIFYYFSLLCNFFGGHLKHYSSK